MYPFEATEIEKIEEKGVQTLMIGEYLELHPLARLEWIKVFGLLLDEYEKADQYYEYAMNEYLLSIEAPRNSDNKFFMNLPYGDSWYAPSRSSLIVSLCHDAGLDYYFSDEGGTENVPHSKEEMWEVGAEVPYWIIVASRPEGYSLDDLKQEEPVYKEFRSVKEKRVIFCNTATSDYFTYGVNRATCNAGRTEYGDRWFQLARS